jgi:hypothetical protein
MGTTFLNIAILGSRHQLHFIAQRLRWRRIKPVTLQVWAPTIVNRYFNTAFHSMRNTVDGLIIQTRVLQQG